MSYNVVGGELESVVEPDHCLRVNVRTLLRLPVELRQIVVMLTDCSPTEVSRGTGLSRAKLYRIIASALGDLHQCWPAARLTAPARTKASRRPERWAN